MTFTFQLRRGTAAQWAAINPVLRAGEPGFELDTGVLKIGNGFDEWDELPSGGGGGGVGPAGDDAYEVAVENGFVGTVEEWLESLVGPQGPQGIQGTQGIQGPQGIQGTQGTQGNQGIPGADGDSAYQVALDNGFVGTESEWLDSLVGPQGEQGPQGTQGIQGNPGADGDSAYEIAVTNGFVGTEAEWLLSLKGETGDTGPAGADGADGADGEDYTGPSITVASSAPSSPAVGDVWIDTSS